MVLLEAFADAEGRSRAGRLVGGEGSVEVGLSFADLEDAIGSSGDLFI